MGQLTWLPDVLRAAGLDVYVMPGALERTTYSSSGAARTMPARPPAVIWHHTATSTAWLDGHVAALLRDGRRDLPGPLTQLGVERDGTIVVVACGRANHDGYGRWGNDAIGVEFYNAGDGVDPWPAVQLEAGQRAIAAILRHLELGADRCIGHKESAAHKIDPRPLDMHVMRARIADYIVTPASPADLEGDDLNDHQQRQLNAIYESIVERKAGTPGGLIHDYAKATRLGVIELVGRKPVDLDVDVDAAAARIADLLDDNLADAVADELDRRQRARLDEVTDA